MIQFCKIPTANITQDVLDNTIHDTFNSFCNNSQTGESIAAWDGEKPAVLEGYPELTVEEVAGLIQTPNNGWTRPYELTPTEANHLPDEILTMLSLSPEEIAWVREVG